MPLAPSKHDIVKSYRDLYRSALWAVQYSSPARYVLKSHLRLAYRSNHASSYNLPKINNTLVFLKHAAKEKGLEHRLLKNLLHVWWWQEQSSRKRKEAKSLSPTRAKTRDAIANSAFQHFNVTLKLLNESMNMCLPERELNEKAVEELDYWKELRFFGGQPQAARKEDKHSLLEDVPVRKVLVLGQL